MSRPPIRVIGYGSLMSAHGLGPQAPGVRAGQVVRVAGRRAFGKPSWRRAYLAMDVVPPARATLHAAAVDPTLVADGAADGGFEALLLDFAPEGSEALARREGYAEACWLRLLDAAGERGLGAFLLDLAAAAGDDRVAYRAALREVAGPLPYDAYHYVPHPVETGGEPAVIFVSPEPGGTGDPTRDSCKAAYPGLRPHRLDTLYAGGAEAFPGGFDAGYQERYVEKCLLAAAHGIQVSDLLGAGLSGACPTGALLDAWRRDRAVLEAERRAAAFLGALVEDVVSALARSGLATRRG